MAYFHDRFAAEWVSLIGNPVHKGKSAEVLHKNIRVCSAHFTKEDYNNSRSKILKWNAKPSLFLPGTYDGNNKYFFPPIN